MSSPFTKTLGAFIENYGSLTSGILNTKYDTGLAWMINNDLQLDLFGGYAVNQGLSEYFISTGISARTHREK